MRYSCEQPRRNCLSPGEALGWPVTRKQEELVSSHSAELRGGSACCGILRLARVQKGIEEKAVKDY